MSVSPDRRKFNRFENSRESTRSTNSVIMEPSELVQQHRTPMNQEQFDRRFNYDPPNRPSTIVTGVKRWASKYYRPFTSCNKLTNTILSFIPILSWLPKYSLKNDLLYDFLGGLTVGIMHVPQGIAYAVLAGQDPVVGLYTSFFPVLAYMMFGTSKHCSIGSFAVVALMAGHAVRRITETPDLLSAANATELLMNGSSTVVPVPSAYTPVQVAATLTFLIGMCQVLVGFLGLDLVTTYFSDELVSGFTTGASVHVFTTQLNDVLGIYGNPHRSGVANLFMKLFDLGAAWERTNLMAVAISAVTMVVLLIGRYVLNPKFQKTFHSPIQIPFELLVVIVATVVSSLLNFESNYNVQTIGVIPTGLPAPVLPSSSLFVQLLPDAISISVVIMAIHVSLAKMFAKKYNYVVDTNQEFYAMGFTSLLSGFFPTYPNSCSLTRTIINGNAGTKTQLSALFSSLFILAVVQFSGSWLQPLPMCVLGSIIVIALIGMVKKFAQLKELWPVSKIDCSIWIVSFLATVCIDVMQGLAIAISYALFTTVIRQQWPKWHMLANMNGTTEYRDVEKYRDVYFFNGVCIFRFDCPLLFTNVDRFRSVISKIAADWKVGATNEIDEIQLIKSKSNKGAHGQRYIVVDCSGFVYVDMMGINALKDVFVEMRDIGVRVSLAASKSNLREMFAAAGLHEQVPLSNFYPSIFDAISFAQMEQTGEIPSPSVSYHNSIVETSDEECLSKTDSQL